MFLYTIGEVSKFTGLSIKMLRYYDRIDLVCPSERKSHSKYRYYSLEQLHTLSMIYYLSFKLQVPLSEIRSIIQAGEYQGDKLIQLLEKQESVIKNKITALKIASKQLHDKIQLLKEHENITFNTPFFQDFPSRRYVFYNTDITNTHDKIQENLRRMVTSFKPANRSALCAFFFSDMKDSTSSWSSSGVAIITDEHRQLPEFFLPAGTYIVLPFVFSPDNFEKALQTLKQFIISNNSIVKNNFLLIIDYIDGAAAWETRGYLFELQIMLTSENQA